MPFRFDRQTLCWINGDSVENYIPPFVGGGIAEGAGIPNHIYPTLTIYYDPDTKQNYRYLTDGWGKYGWHHTPNLVNNPCKCDKCMGIGNEFDEYDIIKRQIPIDIEGAILTECSACGHPHNKPIDVCVECGNQVFWDIPIDRG